MTMRYRPEIDGLRAVAVVAVILYHMGLSFKGGYLGVDVFFVISGYLITLLILTELQETGRFSYASFYERRARRILPALGLVIAAAIPVAWVCMDGAQLQAFGLALLSIAGFASNLLFWATSDYFAPASELLPMLHTWSLAIEEQFYLLFPVVLLLAWNRARGRILPLIALGLIGSLQLADWSSQQHLSPDFAFYLLPTRGWELLAGALLAQVEFETGRPPRKIADAVMPALGLFFVLHPLLFFDRSIQHPSFLTLLPVLGTAILIRFCRKGEPVTDLLASRPFVAVGLISYSLYLWHVPGLVFLRLFNLGELPGGTAYWFLPALLAVGFLSWKHVESPCRNRSLLTRRRFVLIMLAVWTGIIATGLVFYVNDGFPQRMHFPEGLEQSFATSPDLKGCMKDSTTLTAAEAVHCDLSEKRDGAIDFILIGDSHAYATITAFQDFADENGLRAVAATQGACPPLLGMNRRGCEAMNQRVFELVRAHGIPTVFIVANWNFHRGLPATDAETGILETSDSGMRRLFEKAFDHTLAQYRRIGARVVVMGRVPMQNHKVREIYKKITMLPPPLREAALREMPVSRRDYERQRAYFHALFNRHRADDFIYLDPTDYFCDGERCEFGTLDRSLYWDHDHLSMVGARRILRLLTDRADRLLAK